MHGYALITFCAIIAAGFACHWIAWRVRLPAILFLLLAGIVAGPLLHWLDSDALLGDLMVPVVSIAVAIILFEGSLTLKFAELRGHGAVVRNLVTLGVVITWLSSGLAVHFLLGWDLYLAALFGAIVTVSGPTVVMPLLRTVKPAKSVSSVLRWEAILIDPIGAILSLLVFDVIVATQASEGMLQVVTAVITIVLAGFALGAIGGYLLGIVIRRRLIPDFLRDYAALAAALSVFATAEAVHSESGLLAVTVMGIWIANMRHVELEDVLHFKESLTLLLVAGLFILLAARLDLAALLQMGVGALVIVAILQFLAGPLRAMLCSIGSPLNLRERFFLGWIFPRGIVAAAISALFTLRLEQIGYPGAANLVPLVFTVILGTVIVQSISARPLAHWLGVAEPDATGVLIVGSNRFALAIATELKEHGQSVMIADSHWASIQEARMRGIPTFYGSAVSSYADQNLELTGLGTLLTMSRSPGLNELACIRFTGDFGRDNVFTVSIESHTEHDKHKVSGERRGRVLFAGEKSLDDLLDRVRRGDDIKTTPLSEEFDYAAYQLRNADGLQLYATDDKGRVHFPVVDKALEPKPGWTVTSMVAVEKAA